MCTCTVSNPRHCTGSFGGLPYKDRWDRELGPFPGSPASEELTLDTWRHAKDYTLERFHWWLMKTWVFLLPFPWSPLHRNGNMYHLLKKSSLGAGKSNHTCGTWGKWLCPCMEWGLGMYFYFPIKLRLLFPLEIHLKLLVEQWQLQYNNNVQTMPFTCLTGPTCIVWGILGNNFHQFRSTLLPRVMETNTASGPDPGFIAATKESRGCGWQCHNPKAPTSRDTGPKQDTHVWVMARSPHKPVSWFYPSFRKDRKQKPDDWVCSQAGKVPLDQPEDNRHRPWTKQIL